MKKVIMAIMIVVILFAMSGCVKKEKTVERNSWTFYNTEVAKSRIEELLKCIENDDSKAIKKMFANRVLKAESDFDQQEGAFLKCFKSGINRYYFSGKVYKKEKKEEVDYNCWKTVFKYSFIVFTKDNIYELSIKDVQQDDDYANNIGLHYIYVKRISKYTNNEKYEVYHKGEIKGNGIIIK